ncbi:MAG TPA: molybdate ABC transporter permease subunit [Thermoanaerobaculia bacterium]|nr:molybdate ABC transporter permease subunit [Thermoanaerobaculia bacterium]
MLSAEEWQITRLSLATAALATALLLPPGIALGWLLARRRFAGKALLETLIALPLVMPPVATGFILLRLLGRRGPLGDWLERVGLDVVFTWRGVVVAMAVMSLPLLVRGAAVAFESVEPRLEQVARTLGASGSRVFLTISLPLAARGIASGALLAFARALGEFGATIVLAGNVPGRTTTLSLEIFQRIQLGQGTGTSRLLAVSVALAFGAVALHQWLMSRERRRR